MKNKFSQLLDSVDVLSEDVKSSITEAFEDAVQRRVDERVKLEVDKELIKLDEKHATQLNKLLEEVDKDHTHKFEEAIALLDKDRSLKLEKVIQHYEKALKNDAKSLREELCNDISDFMDVYIEKMIPANDIKEAVKNAQASRMVESIKQIVGIDPRFISENVKEALKDGKEKIEGLHLKYNQSLKENIDLKKQNATIQARAMLVEKTQDMPAAKKKFVFNLLEGKSPSYVENNFKFVVEMFEKETDDRQLLREDRKPLRDGKRIQSRRPLSESVDTPAKVEDPQVSAVTSGTNEYLEYMKR